MANVPKKLWWANWIDSLPKLKIKCIGEGASQMAPWGNSCHPCADAMLRFFEDSHLQKGLSDVSSKWQHRLRAFRLYRPENNFGKDYGLYTATSFPTWPFWEILLLGFSGSVSHKIFNVTPLALSSTHPVSLTFMPQNCGFHGLDFRVRWIPATISPWASILHFSVYYRATPLVAQSSFLASLMTIAAGVAVYNNVFRRFCEPCFHWVATRELRLITLWNPPTGRWYMLKLGTC